MCECVHVSVPLALGELKHSVAFATAQRKGSGREGAGLSGCLQRVTPVSLSPAGRSSLIANRLCTLAVCGGSRVQAPRLLRLQLPFPCTEPAGRATQGAASCPGHRLRAPSRTAALPAANSPPWPPLRSPSLAATPVNTSARCVSGPALSDPGPAWEGKRQRVAREPGLMVTVAHLRD